ncbi:hypothetical protein B0H13DRAFT_2324591 [Mycena leptocephala]|nr:hypothetical protein B0H13DRAFT_2324591 [Mycena leptocephala]
MVDIGVIRFPDIYHPHFARANSRFLIGTLSSSGSESRRILSVQTDANGITGQFNSRIFRPRSSLNEAAKKEAIMEAEDLFA